MRHVVGRGAFGAVVHLAFCDHAGIADFQCEVFLRGAHLGECFSVLGLGGEVVNFIGVALQVVEFFRVFRHLPEDRLLGRELASVVELSPHARAGCFKLVGDMLALREVRHVIAEIDEAAIGDAAHTVVAFVHAATEAIDEGLRFGLEFAGEGVALHPLWRLHADDAEQRGREIDKADEAVRLHACAIFLRREVLPLGREIDDHGHLQAGVAGPALVARHAAAVIGVVEDDRVRRQTSGFEFLQACACGGIGECDLIIILRPVLAHFGRVGMVGRDADFGRIMNGHMRAFAELAFMAAHLVEDGEEGLAVLAVHPMRLAGGYVPHALGLFQVVVLFAVVRAVVARFAEELRIHLRALWHGHHAAHVLTAGGWRVHARDDGGACCGAHRCAGPCVFEEHAFRRQSIDVWRIGKRVAVAAHVRPMVLAGEPEDVGPLCGE